MKLTRRDFIKAGLGSFAYLSAAGTVPVWLAKSAHGLSSGFIDDRILILVQLGGGNDGLNTVIPYEDDNYYHARPRLGVQNDYHVLGDGLNALHPRMGGLMKWWEDGYLSVIQNVGYPNPNLSHFLSNDFYEYGASPGSAQQAVGRGWAARFFDNNCEGVPPEQIPALSMLALSTSEMPITLAGSELYLPPRVSDLSSFRIETGNELRAPYLTALNRLNVPTSDLDFIQRVENVAEATVEEFMLADNTPNLRDYPGGSLGEGFRNISKLIRSGRDTKIYFVHQGGYDTHAEQSNDNPNYGEHPDLLSDLSVSLDRFLSDMKDSGNLGKVLIMTFSEFGRRVDENSSHGTDHGGANCCLVLGGGANGGVHGGQPDLDPGRLENGNLAHEVDFRTVYANVIEDWFKADASAVFGADYSDPIFGIQSGQTAVPFVNPNPGTNVGPGVVGGCAG
ncbi:MAG: DUF1501 domain-containing protein [Candidatus Hydrogenedentes bacterium]|nr:DUF1501 domain-containing protein [Candidatus Hydrogenedentota bacterium]